MWYNTIETRCGAMKKYYVYILTNANNRVMYIGVTDDLKRRLHEHKSKAIPGFTSKYNVNRLVYYESFVFSC